MVSADYYQKAFLLFSAIKTAQYTDNLDTYDINDETKRQLMMYFEEKAWYGKAEDWLFELIENNYPNMINEGKLFYARLLEKDDNVLEQGNLPRSEIIESLSQL